MSTNEMKMKKSKNERAAGIPRPKVGGSRVANMKLTERDVWLFLFLHDTRFLKREQIERVFFSNNGKITETTRAKANRRLAKLTNHGFLDRIYRPVTIGKAQAVYCLGKNAYPMLKKVLGPDKKDLVYKRRNNKVEFLFLDHALGIAEFRVQLELATRNNPDIDLLFWERESEALNDRVTDPTGKQKYLPVRPDAFFGLKTDQGKSYFFLEVDMGTESLKRFAKKIIAYKQYWKSGKYTQKYGYKHFRVLTVAESERRLVNLIDATAKAGGKSMFLFTTFDGIEKSILGPVWFSPVSGEPSSLLG